MVSDGDSCKICRFFWLVPVSVAATEKNDPNFAPLNKCFSGLSSSSLGLLLENAKRGAQRRLGAARRRRRTRSCSSWVPWGVCFSAKTGNPRWSRGGAVGDYYDDDSEGGIFFRGTNPQGGIDLFTQREPRT